MVDGEPGPPAGSYSARDMTVLEGLEPVRKRPGCTSAPPVRPVCTTWSGRSSTTRSTRRWPGYCTRIDVDAAGRRRRAGSIDDGRGIPVDQNPEHGKTGGRDRPHDAARRRQVRRGRLQGLRRPARRRRVGGQRPVRRASWSRSTATASATAWSSPTAASPRASSRWSGRRRGGRTGTTVTFWPDAAIFEEHRVPRPDHPRAAADDGLPQHGPGDPLRRRARRARPRAHRLPATPAASSTSSATSTPPRSRCSSRSATTRRPRTTGGRDRLPVEHRLLRGHPLLRQRHRHRSRAACTKRASARPSPMSSTSTPGPRDRSRRRTTTSPARTSARVSPPSSRAARGPAVRGPDQGQARQRLDPLAGRAGHQREAGRLAGGAPHRGQPDRQEGGAGRSGPAWPPARPATPPGASRPSRAPACPAS